MKVTFETEDPKEIKRIMQADDLAFCLSKIVNNGWRQFKHSDYDYQPAWEAIDKIVKHYGIDLDDLL